jgi:hypothetical protein
VIERPRYFRIVLNKYESIIVLKRFFLHGSDEEVMKEIIVSNVGNKAKLLGYHRAAEQALAADSP